MFSLRRNNAPFFDLFLEMSSRLIGCVVEGSFAIYMQREGEVGRERRTRTQERESDGESVSKRVRVRVRRGRGRE